MKFGRRVKRKPFAAAREAIAANPHLAESFRTYQADPTLQGWWALRGLMIVPFSFRTGAIWASLGRLAWYEKTAAVSGKGKDERPPYTFAVNNAEAYPDEAGRFPPPERILQAIELRLTGKYVPVPVGPLGIRPVEGAAVPIPDPEPVPMPAGQFKLYFGRNENWEFWANEVSELGPSLQIARRRRTSRESQQFGEGWAKWTAFYTDPEDNTRIFSTRINQRTTTTRTIMAEEPGDVLQQLEPWGIRGKLMGGRIWIYPEGYDQPPALVDSKRANRRGSR